MSSVLGSLHRWKAEDTSFPLDFGVPSPINPIPKSNQLNVSLGSGKPVELGGQTVSAPGEVAQVALQLALGLTALLTMLLDVTRWPSGDPELPPPTSYQLWHQGRPHQGEPPHASA